MDVENIYRNALKSITVGWKRLWRTRHDVHDNLIIEIMDVEDLLLHCTLLSTIAKNDPVKV